MVVLVVEGWWGLYWCVGGRQVMVGWRGGCNGEMVMRMESGGGEARLQW